MYNDRSRYINPYLAAYDYFYPGHSFRVYSYPNYDYANGNGYCNGYGNGYGNGYYNGYSNVYGNGYYNGYSGYARGYDYYY
ncbi:MAG: hypothetical protein K0S71_2977 [Clostridia bacterium]|jgi:hypothetical protein|nr:hypothetical protein [Clostridia bacterium]